MWPRCWRSDTPANYAFERPESVSCQARTRTALLETLRITLEEAIKFNRAEARRAAGKGFKELTITV